jgi:hypothetical protein
VDNVAAKMRLLVRFGSPTLLTAQPAIAISSLLL